MYNSVRMLYNRAMNANATLTVRYDADDIDDAVRYARLITLDDDSVCEHCSDDITDNVAFELSADADFSSETVTVHVNHLSTDATFPILSITV